MNIHVNDSSPCSDVYIWQDEKKIEYQAFLRNEHTCIAFEEMLCAAAEGCSSDNLCDIFNGMLEVMPCIGKSFESVLNNSLLKMLYVMIMFPFKPALEVTPGRLIIYLYYVPL